MTDMARSTISSPQAQRWIPEGIAMLNARTPAESATELARCSAVVVAIASGHDDALAGRYLDVNWDLDALLLRAAGTPA